MAGRNNHDGFRVFRPVYRARDGEQRSAPRWHVSFRDHNDVWRRVVGPTDHSAALAYGHKLATLVSLRAAGQPIGADLAKWLDGLADKPRMKLVEWGVVDASVSLATQSLVEHVEAWCGALKANRCSEKHISGQRRQVERLIAACGFTRFVDINIGQVREYLGGIDGAVTRNHHARSIKSFAKWMADVGRASSAPLAGLRMVRTADDRKYERRALSADELRRLIAHTATNGKPWCGATGEERAVVYVLAASTGLRRGEIDSLTAASFNLDGNAPTVTVEARASKRRRRDVLPLSADAAARLRAWLIRKLPGAPAFSLPRRTARMIGDDLSAAREAWIGAADDPETRAERVKSGFLRRVDDRGRVADFHSLRVSFITGLARSGVHPRVAQTLARHSSIDLTMNVYSEVGADQQRAGVEALPPLRLADGA